MWDFCDFFYFALTSYCFVTQVFLSTSCNFFGKNQTCSDSIIMCHSTWFLFSILLLICIIYCGGLRSQFKGCMGSDVVGTVGADASAVCACRPQPLTLLPCVQMLARGGTGAVDPTEGGGAGGSTAGCALPLNFQHRSVQERMSTPSSSLPHHPLHVDDKEKNALSYS